MSLVHIEPLRPAMYGFFVARGRPDLSDLAYWATAATDGGVRGELALVSEPDDWDDWLRRTFAVPDSTELVAVRDSRTGRRNYALIEDGRLCVALFLSPDPVLVARQWIVGQLAADRADGASVLAGRPGADMPDSGAIVCACLKVGSLTIADAVRRHGCTTVEAVGATTGAGTNCGSCRAEIRAIIATNRLIAAE